MLYIRHSARPILIPTQHYTLGEFIDYGDFIDYAGRVPTHSTTGRLDYLAASRVFGLHEFVVLWIHPAGYCVHGLLPSGGVG